MTTTDGRSSTDGPLDSPLEHANAMARGTLMERMGIVFTEVGTERLVATMPVEGNTQPYGLLHGGASVVLAETLGSFGSVLHAGPRRIAVGIDINATHHRAARSGVVTGTARPLHLGSTMASWQVEVVDEAGRPVCTSRITCLLRDAPPGG
jgi:1,4-dihydroxy-2-naphthoyl-CoA hydrolase